MTILTTTVLTAAIFFSSCSSDKSVWTVYSKLPTTSDSDKYATSIYEFEWDPIQNRIVGFYTGFEGTEEFSSEASTLEEVRESGYDPRPEGHFLAGKTTVKWEQDDSEGLAEAPMVFQPSGSSRGESGSAGKEGSNGSLEGTISSQLILDGEPVGSEDTGEYYIDTAGTSNPAEYLAENSHTYLYWKAKMAVERGDSQIAAELLEKAIELKNDYKAARELKAQLQ
ncbi:MAG: hypothetical protein K9L68_11680 [Spirochaetales bacterium]|nr:hypothetical protein [Spirochaetales bacterium]MCF7939249.1 hypothetical protein [Spirochaetales bacterium]